MFNPLKPELNPICYLLALLGAHHFLHDSRIRVNVGWSGKESPLIDALHLLPSFVARLIYWAKYLPWPDFIIADVISFIKILVLYRGCNWQSSDNKYSKTCLKRNLKGPEHYSAKARFPFNQGTLHTV
jgi:hypothetical protein